MVGKPQVDMTISGQSASIGVTTTTSGSAGQGVDVCGRRAPETDLGGRGRVVQTEGRSTYEWRYPVPVHSQLSTLSLDDVSQGAECKA